VKLLVTGSAGFIGFHLSRRLLERGDQVVGYDNVNDYYDVRLKHARLDVLHKYPKFKFVHGDLGDRPKLEEAWKALSPEVVVNLAAQAGVRYSLENPMAYIDSNIVGFQNVIDLARQLKLPNLVYASSSSVYGSNTKTPFSEADVTDSPISLYAASKKSNELVAKCYSHLFGLNTTGLRFFTVYGPYSRPDMALYKFASLIKNQKKIEVYNYGKMQRDFTYVDDIVDGILFTIHKPQSAAVYNLARGKAVDLMRMIELLENNLGLKAIKELLPLQAGDVPSTTADISRAQLELGYEPKVDLDVGIARFCQWFHDHTSRM
jgi:UDP-glucuronate 4-epimerase